MIWENLLDDECPECGGALFTDEPYYSCSNYECTFIISKEKALDIIENMERIENWTDICWGGEGGWDEWWK